MKATDLPEDLQAVRDDFIGNKLYTATDPKPKEVEKVEDHRRRVVRAKKFLEGLGKDEMRALLKKEAQSRGYKTKMRGSSGGLTSYGRRVLAVERLTQ